MKKRWLRRLPTNMVTTMKKKLTITRKKLTTPMRKFTILSRRTLTRSISNMNDKLSSCLEAIEIFYS